MKPGGMCWTITAPLPSVAGSAGMRLASAFGPPVEQAITTVRVTPPARRGMLGGAGLGAGAAERCGAGAAAARGRREIAARHILS